MGIRSDGSIITYSHQENPYPEIESWHDIRSLASGQNHIVGLKNDGTVVAAGSNEQGQCNVGQWTDIVAVACGWHFTVGLKTDGSIVFTGAANYGAADAQSWTDIRMVEVCAENITGLKSDGTAVALGKTDAGLCQVPDWTDIIDIYLDRSRGIYLCADGTVKIMGENLYIEDGQQIPGLVTVESDGTYLAGMMADGKLYFVGYQQDISDKGHVVAIVDYCLWKLGLCSDGTVVKLFRYGGSEIEPPAWDGILVP